MLGRGGAGTGEPGAAEPKNSGSCSSRSLGCAAGMVATGAARRSAAAHNVGDEPLFAPQTNHPQHLGQQPARGADEGAALLVLVEARTLADKHDLGVRIALAGHALGARAVQLAEPTGAYFSADGI